MQVACAFYSLPQFLKRSNEKKLGKARMSPHHLDHHLNRDGANGGIDHGQSGMIHSPGLVVPGIEFIVQREEIDKVTHLDKIDALTHARFRSELRNEAPIHNDVERAAESPIRNYVSLRKGDDAGFFAQEPAHFNRQVRAKRRRNLIPALHTGHVMPCPPVAAIVIHLHHRTTPCPISEKSPLDLFERHSKSTSDARNTLPYRGALKPPRSQQSRGLAPRNTFLKPGSSTQYSGFGV